MSLSCQCLRDTYCQLGVILSAHFDGVQEIMSSVKISAIKKKKSEPSEWLPVKVQTRLLGFRRWSCHWIWNRQPYLVALLLIFIPYCLASCRPTSGAWNITLLKKYYKPEQNSQACPENAFFNLCRNSRQHTFSRETYGWLFQKLNNPFEIQQLWMLYIFSDNKDRH